MMLIIAAILLVIAFIFVVWPLFHAQPQTHSQHVQQEKNLELYHQREQEILEGDYSEEEKAQLKLELDRDLLSSQMSEALPVSGIERANTRFMVSVGIFIALVTGSVWLYQELGASEDIRLTYLLNEGQKRSLTADERKELKEGLAYISEKRAKKVEWRFIYGQILTADGDHQEAAAVYKKLLEQLPEEAQQDVAATKIMWAQSSYYHNQAVTAEMYDAIKSALEIIPNHQQGLGLAGIFAVEQNDPKAALEYWKTLWLQLPPSAESVAIEQGVKKVAERIKDESGETVDLSWMDRPGVSLLVDIKPELKAKLTGQEMLFIMAKAVSNNGQPAPAVPLAVTRLSVARLPMNITLTDAQAMAPDLKISLFEQVEVIARVSMSGQPMAQPGDFEGRIAKTKVLPSTANDSDNVLTLTIDTVAE